MAARSSVITISGETIEYTAAWESLPLIGADGEPDASISATTYLATAGEPERPVAFLFNGGPGASASPLHMHAFGPRIITTGAYEQRTIVANPDSLLDQADLVFVDPVGTGFSRALRDGGDEPYLTIDGDAAAVERFIRHWLAEHQRTESPVYLVGESYGGFRLATMCAHISDLPIAGMVFISAFLDASGTTPAPGNDLPHVFDLPTMAVAAWTHGRASADARDVANVFEEADAFAQDEYLSALHRGSTLAATDRRKIAARVGELIGLPTAQVLDADLRVDSEEFLRALLAEENKIVGRLDTRVTGPIPPPPADDRPAAADDPALGMGRSNIRQSDEIAEYLRTEPGATADGSYTTLSLELNFRFDWRSADKKPDFYRNPTANVTELLRDRPDARMLLLGGYFDLATPFAAARHAATHAGLPAEQVRLLPLEAGHSLDGPALRTAAAALREFITSTLHLNS